MSISHSHWKEQSRYSGPMADQGSPKCIVKWRNKSRVRSKPCCCLYMNKSRIYTSTHTCTYLHHIQTYICVYIHSYIFKCTQYIQRYKSIQGYTKGGHCLIKKEGAFLLGQFNILPFVDTTKEREFVNVSCFVGFIRREACRDPSNIHPSNSSPAGGYNKIQGKALQTSTLSLIWSLHRLQVAFILYCKGDSP